MQKKNCAHSEQYCFSFLQDSSFMMASKEDILMELLASPNVAHTCRMPGPTQTSIKGSSRLSSNFLNFWRTLKSFRHCGCKFSFSMKSRSTRQTSVWSFLLCSVDFFCVIAPLPKEEVFSILVEVVVVLEWVVD